MVKPIFSDSAEWFAALDQERFNVAHYSERKPEAKIVEVPVAVKCHRKHSDKACTKRHVTEARDQMLFNAGRYAAGATDFVAVEAHAKLMESLGDSL
jgi:hypothetical protein